MMSKKILQFCFVPILMLFAGCNNAANIDWRGTYLYEHEVGEGAGGISSFIEYTLTIADDKCSLAIVGLQTDEQIICSTKTSGDSVSIAFKSYANGSTTNALGIDVYTVDGTLFSLNNNKDGYITKWQDLVPDGTKELSGKYFVLTK
jgi:hypothetical protein